MRHRVLSASILFIFSALACLAGTPRDLQLAASSGDLEGVKALIDGGVPVDAADDWGTTPLILAAKNQQFEIARYLLEKGADPSARESFFGISALQMALWKGDPDYAVAKILLEAGAADRISAIETGLRSDDLALARAAVASGPVLESEAESLREKLIDVKGEAAEILAAMTTVADPTPPSYSAAELADFTGHFEDREGNAAQVALSEADLVLEFEGKRTSLRVFKERGFRHTEKQLSLDFFGRANTVEGFTLTRSGREPTRLRRAESPIVGAADLPEFAADPDAEPTLHWPGFRGLNRDGIGDGLETPVSFDLASGEGIAWSVEVPGLGNSSPVVWGDTVILTTAVAAGGSTPLKTGLTGAGDEVEENVEHRWLVLAYDKASGRKVWETEVGKGVPLTKRHFKATQANSSPFTDGEHVVVVFPTAGLACLGIDGKLHWKHELGGLNAGGFNDPGIQWGFAASPIIHDGKVVLQVDIHEGPYLAAWDLESGKPLWRTERPDVAPSWSTPAIWSTPAGDELVVNASVIRGYDPQNGKELWSLGPTSIQVVASPVVGAENLFVSSGYPPARPIYAVKPGIRGAHSIESDEDAAPLAWYAERGGAYMPTPLLYRGLFYVVHHNAKIVAHDARSGDRVYQARFSAGGTMTASPVVANGKIYQGSEEGMLYVLAAGPEHRELAVHDFGEPLMATPAISEGLVLVRTPSKLYALGGKKKPREP